MAACPEALEWLQRADGDAQTAPPTVARAIKDMEAIRRVAQEFLGMRSEPVSE